MYFKVEHNGISIEWESKNEDREINIITHAGIVTSTRCLSKDDAINLISALNNFVGQDECSCECEIEVENVIEIEVDGCCCSAFSHKCDETVTEVNNDFKIDVFVRDVISAVTLKTGGRRILIDEENEEVSEWYSRFSDKNWWGDTRSHEYFVHVVAPFFVYF